MSGDRTVEEDEFHILQMVEEGLINAEEAATLLDAIGAENSGIDISEHRSATINSASANNIAPVATPKDKFGRLSTVIHLLVVGSLLISAIGVALMYQSAEQVVLIGFLCTWLIFIISFLMTLFLVFTRSSPWLFIRIHRIGGRIISLNFPLPLIVLSWAINIARPFVLKENKGKLDLASAYIKAMASNQDAQPLEINLGDVDSARIEIILG